MESKQLYEIDKESILKDIAAWYRKIGIQKTNNLRFDIPDKVCMLNFQVVESIEQILKTDLVCDLELTQDWLEEVHMYVNRL